MSVSPAIETGRVEALLSAEVERFTSEHPRSGELASQAREDLLDGVPMSWMSHWASPYPVYLERAQGARVLDVDGHDYVDFCLGDTAAMAGHGLPEVAEAAARRMSAGATAMLPTADGAWVAGELSRRFGRRSWQFTLSATDANRFVIRIARALTGRPKILVFNHCYHGTVDETFATTSEGRVVARAGNVGPPVDLAVTTRVAEFNDLEAVERELGHGDVACVLTEPALTNIGIVLPEPGFLEGVAELAARHGSLLIIDETHTWSAGPGGCTARWSLNSDFLTIGKAIGGGVAAGAFGMSQALAERLSVASGLDLEDVGGVGGTMAGNALSLAAVRATLSGPLRDEAWVATESVMSRLVAGVEQIVAEAGLGWHITQLGCRAELGFTRRRPRSGSESAAGAQPLLERFLHLFALNRGVLITPFHNMFLACPSTGEEDVDAFLAVFGQAVRVLRGD